MLKLRTAALHALLSAPCSGLADGYGTTTLPD